MKYKKTAILLALLCFTTIQTIFSQHLPAFPGAEGFGANASGGRGGQVIYVTNLNPNGPGSLNEALTTSGKKYILFKVSGMIDAAAEVIYGNTTIAGQTSPNGITVRGFIVDEVYDTIGTGNNIIVRHIRSRPQNTEAFPTSNYILDDACRLDGASNVIIDHCSFANAMDECVQISQSSRITFQNNSLAETIGEHFYLGGMLLNYSTPEHPLDSIAVHHNVWNRLGGRLPELSCESPYCSARPLNLELSNNLIWDPPINIWYNSNIDPSANNPIDKFFLNLNWINNLGFARSTYGNGLIAHNILEFAGNHIFASGNKLNLYPNYADYDLFYCCNDFNLSENNPNTDMGVAIRLASRHPFPSITYHPASSLADYLINNAGAFPRDSMDRRLFNPLRTGLIDPTPVDSTDPYRDAFIRDENTTQPPQDSDNDGMPDYWENAQGLNPAIQDHNGTNLSVQITGTAGYTNLECYLNCLSDFLVSGQTSSQCGIGLNTLDSPSYLNDLIKLFPNPASTTINLQLPLNHCQLTIYDLYGRTVLEKNLNSNNEQLNLNLTGGVYFYQVRNKGQNLGRGKIIIQ